MGLGSPTAQPGAYEISNCSHHTVSADGVALFGDPKRSFVNVATDEVEVRFGFTHLRIPRSEIRSVTLDQQRGFFGWGIGWRTDLRGTVAPVGANDNFVKLDLAVPRKIFVGIPVTAQRIVLSLEQPAEFVAQFKS